MGLGPEYLLPHARLAVYLWPRQFGSDAIVKELGKKCLTRK
jgi:hypothetical protein